jgi:diguanylate cyclase (GGDEF)-like protein/PAS domain S-box-containing protein
MFNKKMFRHLLEPYQPKEELTRALYSLLGRSLAALFFFTLFLTFFLYDALGDKIEIWCAVLLFIIAVRAVFIGLYFYKKEIFSTDRWYAIFVFFTLLTAVVLGAVGVVFFSEVNDLNKLFIVTAMVGLSSGAHASLHPDIRLMMLYALIILLPLIVGSFGVETKFFFVVGLMLILYLSTLYMIALNAYLLGKEAKQKEKEAERTKEELFRKQERLQYFYTQAPVPIFSYDTNLVITDCNLAFLKMFQLEKEEIIGRSMKDLREEYPWRMAQKALKEGPQYYSGYYTSLKGMRFWIEAKSFPLHDRRGNVIGGFIMIEDKTKEREAINELHFMAQHDPLTLLYNRRAFHVYMKELVASEKHEEYFSGVFYIDLNRFKYINDTLGHHFGDMLLTEVAERIREVSQRYDRGEGIVARLGGDEFVIVTPFISKHYENAREYCERLACDLQKCFDTVFEIETIRLYIKASVGVVVIEPGEKNTDELVRRADISMYQAKSRDDLCVAYYDETLDHFRKETFSLQQDLMHALKHGDFRLFFQPIVSSRDHRIYAAEALIRWEHPEKGVIPPSSFIPLAVELGIITEIGDWVIEEAMRTVAEWKRRGTWCLDYISVNIDAKQIVRNGFYERFAELTERYGIERGEITLEVTENSLIDNFDTTNEVLKKLKTLGIRCAIDDFGTGYSSLSYLKKLSFSILKVDRAFMHELIESDENVMLISIFMMLAEKLNYDIVLEGIEEEIQLERLKSLKEDFGYQGYLIGKPADKETFERKFLKVCED